MRPFFLALGLLATVHAHAETLADVLNRAWLRLPQAQSQSARTDALRANAQLAAGVFAAPPVLGFGHRTDRFNRDAGSREIEIDVSVPLWLPGEKEARQRVAAYEGARFSNEQAVLRLRLAGELREAVWQAREAESLLAAIENRLTTVRRTEADVQRRVKAGELARVDLLLAQEESAAVLAEMADAKRALLAARQTYSRLVGDGTLPEKAAELPQRAPDLDHHPLLAAQRARLELARAKARLASETRRDHPELSVGMRRERNDIAEPYGNSVGIALKLPLGSDAQNTGRIAEAQAELAEAEAGLQLQRIEIEQDIRQATEGIDIARQGSTLAGSRLALAEERLQLIRKAFSLGENSLFELQRAQSMRDIAALAAGQSEIALHRAYARLNQAQGVLP